MFGNKVSVQFSASGNSLIVRCPYNKDFLAALGWNNIVGTWDNDMKQWYFSAKNFDDIMKLLGDYFT